MNRALPSVLSPTISVAPPTGNVYETPSTDRRSPVLSESNSPKVPALPESIAISSESSPVKLVFRFMWKS